MLHFNTDYFKEENRLDFTIPAFMKHAWASQLSILERVDEICTKHNISYFADWGTLLGTIRHKGYIPWDDDIDVCMMRADYYRFREVINEYDDLFVLDIFNTPNYGPNTPRVVNSTSFSMDRNVYKSYCGFPFPTGVDIFMLDYVPRDKALEEELVEAIKVCSEAAHDREWLDEHDALSDKEYSSHFAGYQDAVKWIEKNCGVAFSEENPSHQEILILVQEIMGMYGEESADYITEMPCIANGMPYYIPKNAYDKSINKPFENTVIPVPEEYDSILQLKYGDDYMTPKNVGSGHEYPFYDKLFQAMYNPDKYDDYEEYVDYINNVSARYYIEFLNKNTDTLLDTAKATETNDYSGVLDEGVEFAIKREDVDKFIHVLSLELGAWYNYSTLYSHDSHDDIRMQIWSDKYMCDEEEFAKRFHGCKKKVSLYVSVIDPVTNDAARDEVRQVLIKNLTVTALSMPTTPPYSEEVIAAIREWGEILQTTIDLDKDIRCMLLRHADKLSGNVKDEKVMKVRLNSDYQLSNNAEYDADYFENVAKKPFGITTIRVPGVQ